MLSTGFANPENEIRASRTSTSLFALLARYNLLGEDDLIFVPGPAAHARGRAVELVLIDLRFVAFAHDENRAELLLVEVEGAKRGIS